MAVSPMGVGVGLRARSPDDAAGIKMQRPHARALMLRSSMPRAEVSPRRL